MTDILAKIAAYKRGEVAARRAVIPQHAIDEAIEKAGPTRGFRAALKRAHTPGRLALIAEIKKASPSKGLIRADFDPPHLARAYQAGGASCLSILTDGPSFQGADGFLTAAREACDLPCLRKEFMVDPWQVDQSRALGADAILVNLAANAELQRRYELLCSIPGVGNVSAIALLAELAMLPEDRDVRQWVAYAGLDPRECSSGTSVRKCARISKVGNRHLRHALYMPALVASQHEPHLRGFYQHLLERGKKKMQALVAVARKLLHAIYGMFRSGQRYQGARVFRLSLSTPATAKCA